MQRSGDNNDRRQPPRARTNAGSLYCGCECAPAVALPSAPPPLVHTTVMATRAIRR